VSEGIAAWLLHSRWTLDAGGTLASQVTRIELPDADTQINRISEAKRGDITLPDHANTWKRK
jgi:hypothetical protein